MLFYDFLYYSIARFYSKHKEKGASSSAAGIIGGLQATNVLTLYFIYLMTRVEKPYVDKLLCVALFIVFQVTTYMRYIYRDKHSIELIEQKWLDKSETARKRLKLCIYLYCVLSIVAFFGLAIYLGERNR